MYFGCRRSISIRRRFSAFLAPFAFSALLFVAANLSVAHADSRVLRVAADPNNLPFSNERGEGFENKIAELVAKELGARLEYMWWPQRRGFFRETLGSGRADLVIGVPAGFERVLPTRPYYRSSYVFVFRRGESPVTSFDDPRLQHVRVGVQLVGDDAFNAPPAHALAARGAVENVRGYTLYGNYTDDSPPSAIVRAVATGEIDVAVAWGPMAGYFAQRQPQPLDWRFVSPESDGPMLPFTFRIAMGVRRGAAGLRDEVDRVIERKAADIDRILDAYGVPRLRLRDEKEAPHVATN